jgi:hypothetical protein
MNEIDKRGGGRNLTSEELGYLSEEQKQNLSDIKK